MTTSEHDDATRLLVVARMLLEVIESDDHAASLVSAGFRVELRSMISATERHLGSLE